MDLKCKMDKLILIPINNFQKKHCDEKNMNYENIL